MMVAEGFSTRILIVDDVWGSGRTSTGQLTSMEPPLFEIRTRTWKLEGAGAGTS